LFVSLYRFGKIKKEHAEIFDELFAQYYATVHRLETNKLRNVAKIFAHLLHTGEHLLYSM
jgi:pre-mRNA-splicing factor CWC22